MCKLYIECEKKLEFLPILENNALCNIDISFDCTCELIFMDANAMQQLNMESREINAVTDVLSFPTIDNIKAKKIIAKDYITDIEDGRLFIGSIVVCKEKVMQQSKEYGTTLERELYYVIVHGICHLLGYDHIQDEDKREMRKIEEKLLQTIGLSQDGGGGI